MTSLNYRLLYADVYSYYPAPHWWIRRTWNKTGIQMRLGKVGFSCHYGPGVYCNGHKWVCFWYDEYENTLANGGML